MNRKMEKIQLKPIDRIFGDSKMDMTNGFNNFEINKFSKVDFDDIKIDYGEKCSSKRKNLKRFVNEKVNYNVNNDIKKYTMENTRISKKEKDIEENCRFQYLNKNFQDPNKLILPFPRGGEMTREKYTRNN